MSQDPINKKELVVMKGAAARALELARAAEVVDDTSYGMVGKALVDLKVLRAKVMAVPLAKKKEAHGIWKFIGDICSAVQAPFDQAEAEYDRKMTTYRQELQARQIRAEEVAKQEAEAIRQKELAKATKKGDKSLVRELKAAPLAIEVEEITPAPKVAGVTVRKIWDFEITDAGSIPPDYMEPSLSKIRSYMMDNKEKALMKGVRFFQREVQ